MALNENTIRNHRHLQTWPFRHYPSTTVLNGNQIESKNTYSSELDLTRQQSFQSSIFMTDTSKVLPIDSLSMSIDLTSIAIHPSDGIRVEYRKESSENEENLLECPVCCNHVKLIEFKHMNCCNIKLCSLCLLTHIITNIQYGQGNIQCPSCSEEINPNTILYNNDLSLTIRERYQQILARNLSEKQQTCIKLCPHCNFITIIDENDSKIREKRSRRIEDKWIHCQECEKDWCWSCYAPSHPTQSCQQFKKSHTQLDLWAKTRRLDNNNQRNAQRCPKCSIYIEKIDGCDHMSCTKCNSKFCYRCGSRMRLPFYIGHDAKYSIFGCKYKLWPNRPLLRWIIRGSIFLAVFLLAPIVLGALLSLIAIGIPTVLIIGCFGLPIFICLQCKKRR